MTQDDVNNRIFWAISQPSPVCLRCKKPIGDSIAVSIPVPEYYGKYVFFDPACYDVVVLESHKAHMSFVNMMLGHGDWLSGMRFLDHVAPFRRFIPSKLNFERKEDEI